MNNDAMGWTAEVGKVHRGRALGAEGFLSLCSATRPAGLL